MKAASFVISLTLEAISDRVADDSKNAHIFIIHLLDDVALEDRGVFVVDQVRRHKGEVVLLLKFFEIVDSKHQVQFPNVDRVNSNVFVNFGKDIRF